jgi:hypothetical protein
MVVTGQLRVLVAVPPKESDPVTNSMGQSPSSEANKS